MKPIRLYIARYSRRDENARKLYGVPVLSANSNHGNGVPHVCHYLHDTGELRGCDPDQCDKKKIVSQAERKKHVVKLAQTRFMR